MWHRSLHILLDFINLVNDLLSTIVKIDPSGYTVVCFSNLLQEPGCTDRVFLQSILCSFAGTLQQMCFMAGHDLKGLTLF